jgi:D-threo-aldose 1-dehydrogenase
VSVRDERIHSTICGMVSPAQLAETVRLLELRLPEELWAELDALRPDPEGWIGD